jgi:hypothetical protein
MPTGDSLARGLAGGVLLLALLVACGDDEPSTGDEPSTSTPASTSGTPSPSPSSSSDATTSPPTDGGSTTDGPTVTPASGLLLREETSQLNGPAGEEWARIPDIVTYATAVGSSATGEVVSLSDRENYATSATLDEQVEFHNGTLPEGAVVRRQPNVWLDGVQAYYVKWWVKGATKIQHDIGLDYRGQVISIQMDLDRSDPAASDALAASVLASFRWR